MSWKKVKLKEILKQYRIELLVQNDIEYKQVTISKYDGITFRGTRIGREIGRKRQFQIDLKRFPNTLMFVRQGVQDGSIGIAPIEVEGCIATENMPMFSIEGINLEYLKLLLKSPYFNDELNKIQTTGSAQKSIHEREILEIEIPFPDFEEQEDIVRQLSSKKNNSLEISTELSHQLTLVKKLRQQLLQDAVQGKLVAPSPLERAGGEVEPASELLKKIKEERLNRVGFQPDPKKDIGLKPNKFSNHSSGLKPRAIKELPPIKPEDIPFEIPENWVWCRLGEIAEIGTGATPLTSNPEYYENGDIPWITSSATNNLFIIEPELYITEKALKETNCKVYPAGTLVVAMYGQGKTRGQITELNFPAATNQACATITLFFNEFTLRKYVKLFFQKIYNEIRELAQGGAQPNLNMGKVRDTIISLPPLAEQNRIVQKLDELMQYCNELETSIKQSESQNSTLLQQVLKEALRKEPLEV
ncbi:MAG: restriction endonuclease subunit S [Bacteroidota bacterium]